MGSASLTKLLVINIICFLLINLYLLVLYIAKVDPPDFLGSNLGLAASSDMSTMLHRPWSLITHMFSHIQFGHFLFNMIVLYTMGKMFETLQGSKRLVSLYLLGGFAGFVLFALAFNFVDVYSTDKVHYILGASAAVMSITVATATLQPKREIYLFGAIKLELVWLAAILILLDLASVRGKFNSGGHIGHLGGALFGFIYAKQLQGGKDIGVWLSRLIDWLSQLFTKKAKMRASVNKGRPKTDEQFNMEKHARQRHIDEILDKISRSGYDSLSKSEKEFLFKNTQK